MTVTLSAFFWILLLITVAGLKVHTWYLLGVGCVGMVQNIFAAAVPRNPHAMGLPLDPVARIANHKVMKALMETEDRFPSVGAALVTTFFPGKLRDDELKFWSTRTGMSNRPSGTSPIPF